jgi:hypothetical protein
LRQGLFSEANNKIKELAYTEKYSKYSLTDIIRLNRKALTPVDRKKTGEPSKGGADQARYTADQIDFKRCFGMVLVEPIIS